MLSASNKRPVCDTQSLKAVGRMWCVCVCGCMGGVGCVKNRCFWAFKCGKQEARPASEGSHLAYGFHWHEMKHKDVCVFCLVKDTDQDTVGVIHVPNNSPVRHCTIVWLTTLQPPHRDELRAPWPRIRAPFWAGGSVFEAPFPWLSDPFTL